MAENETISHQKATSEANHGQSILAAHCGPLKTRLSRDSLVKYGADHPNWGDVRGYLQTQLQNSYEKAIFKEIETAANHDMISVEWTAEDFVKEMKLKAYNDCALARKEAVDEFNRDLQLAKKASDKAGGKFVDLEAQEAAAFGDDIKAIIDRS